MLTNLDEKTGDRSRYLRLLDRFDLALERLLRMIETQKLSGYEEEADFAGEITKREELCEEIKAISKQLDKIDWEKVKGSIGPPEGAEQKARIREMLLRIQKANDENITDVNERMLFYKGRLEDLRRTKTGMTAYMKSNVHLKTGHFDRIG